MNTSICTVTPKDLAAATVCLDELSKNLKGELTLLESDVETCRRLDCRTLTTDHLLRVELTGHDCDSELGKLFDGRLTSKDLTTVFVDGSGERRGTHVANFVWKSSAGVVTGELRGMTNEGTHREPAFDACQRCDERGVLEGRLCGTLVKPRDRRLAGAQVTAAYRIRFDPNEKGGEGAVAGTLEGVVVRYCKTGGDCVEFSTVGTDTNPRTVGALTVQTSDTNGPTADTEVVTWDSFTGLRMWHHATLAFAQPVSRVEITLVSYAKPAKVTALDASGAPVATATMSVGQKIAETLVLTGGGITTVVVDSPADEVLMPKVCWQI